MIPDPEQVGSPVPSTIHVDQSVPALTVSYTHLTLPTILLV